MPKITCGCPRLGWLRCLSLCLSYLAICGEWQFMSFTVYLNALKEQFTLTQLQVNLMLGLNNLGFVFTFPAGLIVRKYGPHRACAFATTLTGACYLLLWCATHHRDFHNQRADLLLVYFLGVGVGCAINFAAIMEAISRMFPPRDVPGITSGLMSATNVGPLLFTCMYTMMFYGEWFPHGQRLGDYMLFTGVYHVTLHTLALMTYTEKEDDYAALPYELQDLDKSSVSRTKSTGYGAMERSTKTSHPSFVFDGKYTLPNKLELKESYTSDSSQVNTTDSQQQSNNHELNIVDMIYALNRLKLYTSRGEMCNETTYISSDFSIPNSPTPLLEDDVFEDDPEPSSADVTGLLKLLVIALKSPRFYLILWASVFLMGLRAMCVGNLNAYLVSFFLTAHRAHLPYVSPVSGIVIKLCYMAITFIMGYRTPKVGLLAMSAAIAMLGFILALFPIPNPYAISFVIMLWTLAGTCALCCAPAIFSEAFDLQHFPISTGLVVSVSAIVSFICQIFLGAMYDVYTPDGERTCFGLNCYIWSFGIGIFLSAVAAICAVVYAQLGKRGVDRKPGY